VGFAALQEKNYSESIRSLCVRVCVRACVRACVRERERKKLMIFSLKL
jgi:hypothetical protein